MAKGMLIRTLYRLVRSAEYNDPKKVETDTNAFLRAVSINGISHPRARPIGYFLLERGKYLVQVREVCVQIESSTVCI